MTLGAGAFSTVMFQGAAIMFCDMIFGPAMLGNIALLSTKAQDCLLRDMKCTNTERACSRMNISTSRCVQQVKKTHALHALVV